MHLVDPAVVEVLKDRHLLDIVRLEQEILPHDLLLLKVLLEEQDIILQVLKTVAVEEELVELEEMLQHLIQQMVLEV